MNADKLRREYRAHSGHLLEQNVSLNPFEQFEKWFADAIAAKLDLPDAMTLATATPQAVPSARMVVLRGFDAKVFASTPIMGAKRERNSRRTRTPRWYSIGVSLIDRFGVLASSRK